MTAVADVRVYLLTYRRNHLLPRALNSLLAQTHRNWICEVHNDDPDDRFPEKLIAETNDPRITYQPHARHLGPVANFDHVFQPVREAFVSLLEDDNWWEPRLLERLLTALAPHPSINLAWANCYMWRETDAGEWQKAGTIWPVTGEDVTIFDTPDPRQACRALHSNGAMLLRAIPLTMVKSPASVRFAVIEHVRERAYPGKLLLVREPLGNYALTRETARSETADENMQMTVLLAMTLMMRCPNTAEFYQQMWTACRGSRGHHQRALVVAGMMAGRLRRVLLSATFSEVLMVAGWALRHPRRFANLFSAPQRFPDVFEFLEAAGARHAADAK